MLKAVLSKGNLQYRWVPNGLFDDDRIVGDPLYDGNGKIEEVVWVDLLPGDILQVNAARKTSILAQRALDKQKEDDETDERKQIITNLKQLYQDVQNATTAAQIRVILEKIVRLLGLIYAK